MQLKVAALIIITRRVDVWIRTCLTPATFVRITNVIELKSNILWTDYTFLFNQIVI